MSMRTIDKQTGPDHWDSEQSAELVSGTLGIALAFGLVCLFLMVMVH
ncbi:MAG: hypothetical protein AAF942_17440 [Pseudomonadota bacterium]